MSHSVLRKQRTVEASVAMRGHRSLSGSSLGPCSPLRISNSMILQTEPWVLLHFPVCDGLISSTGLAGSLGPSRPARKGGISLKPRNLEASSEGKKKHLWLTWFRAPSGPDSERRGTNTWPARSEVSEQLKEHLTVCPKTWFMFMATRFTPEKLKTRNYFHLLLFSEYFGVTCR